MVFEQSESDAPPLPGHVEQLNDGAEGQQLRGATRTSTSPSPISGRTHSISATVHDPAGGNPSPGDQEHGSHDAVK